MVQNLTRLIAREYPTVAPNTAYKRIERATGTSLSTLQRIMSGETGPSVDTLADLAYHLGSTVTEILSPFRKTSDIEPSTRRPGSSRTPPY